MIVPPHPLLLLLSLLLLCILLLFISFFIHILLVLNVNSTGGLLTQTMQKAWTNLFVRHNLFQVQTNKLSCLCYQHVFLFASKRTQLSKFVQGRCCNRMLLKLKFTQQKATIGIPLSKPAPEKEKNTVQYKMKDLSTIELQKIKLCPFKVKMSMKKIEKLDFITYIRATVVFSHEYTQTIW